MFSVEKYYPLRVRFCEQCWLVQTEDYTHADELFDSEYSYFSSTSSTWLEHAVNYANMVIERFELNSKSLVLEIACNDGYLLKNFVAKNIPCLGIEPTASTALMAESLGIPVLREFFCEALGKHLSEIGKKADIIIGNNVYAHVPDVNDFTLGLKAALAVNGVISLEFPHLMQMLKHSQFDTIYHEHFSYFSLHTVSLIFEKYGLRVWDVEQLATHGGSLRVFGCHTDDARETKSSVRELIEMEKLAGLRNITTYNLFQIRANRIKDDLLEFLIQQKRNGKIVWAYGAAAKGNTLLNYAGVKPDLLPIVCDASIAKQGKYMPGSHIPIHSPKILATVCPDYIIILPWNISEEIKKQLSHIVNKNCRFVKAVPCLEVL